jgi:outer membrane protein assembly factor BamB
MVGRMKRLTCLVAAAAAFAAVSLAHAEDLAPEQQAAADALIRQLSVDDATAREAAEDALVALGEPIRALLRSRADDVGAEASRRIRSILRRLDDALTHADSGSLTWAGLRGNPSRNGIAGGDIPAVQPETAWSVRVDTTELLQGGVVPGERRISCLSGDGVVRCFSAENGSRLWLANLEAKISASAVLAGGRLVIPTSRGLVALDESTGRRVWEQKAAYGCDAAPAIDGGRVFAAFRSLGVQAFDVVTGDRTFEAPMAPSGALLVDGDLIVAGTEDGYLVRLHSDTGKPVWRVELGSAPNMGPTLAGPGMIAVLARDRYLRVIGAETGKTLWERRLPHVSNSESLVAAAGRVFLTDAGGSIRAYDAGTGRSLWQRNEGMLSMGGPCATDRRVMWGARGRLTCRDAKTGVLQWRLDVDAIDDAVPVIRDGVVYFLTDRELLALRSPEAPTTPSGR